VGKSEEGKRPLGRPRRRLLDNIEMDLGEIGWNNVYWIGLAQDKEPVEGSFECGDEPFDCTKCSGILSNCATGGISRRV
jgi:hypothetical protein